MHQSHPDTLPDGSHIGRTALRVEDLDRVTEFYRTVVGLDVLENDDASATLGANRTALLELEAAPDAGARPDTAAGLFHNAFRVPSRAALGDALTRVREHWELDGASDHLVSEALYLRDPEGNGVEIYRDFPRAEWPAGDDGTVRMATEPLDLDPITAAAEGAAMAPPGTDVGHVHLEVTSLEQFRAVYVDALGFEEQVGVPRAAFVSAGGYHHHVGANTWNHRTSAIEGRGLAWFEIVLPTDTGLAAVRQRLETHDIPSTDRPDGLAVRAPDGIEVRLRVPS